MPADIEAREATYDSYRTYRYRLKCDGRYVAGVARVSPLSRMAQVVMHRPGGDPTTPRRMPGQSRFAAITLERGVTHDPAFAR